MPDTPQDPLVLYRLDAIENDTRAIRVTVEDMNTRMLAKEAESKERDAAIWTAQDKLQIKVLLFILTTVVSLVGGLLVFYITHL